MRRLTLLATGMLVLAGSALAQGTDTTKTKPDSGAAKPASGAARLEGKWTGSISTPNGDMPVNCEIKKDDKNGYVGTISGLEGNVPLKDITFDGEKVAAGAVMSAQGQAIEVWYSFVLKGDVLSGGVSASFNGQSMSFDLTLKRAPTDPK
jgi:hypothetical protein